MSQNQTLNMSGSIESARQQNLDSAILFMQQEHAHTLKLLHEEIHKLQKRCSELTFQLAMETTSTSQEDYYRKQTEDLEEELQEMKRSFSEKQDELKKQEQRNRFLEDQNKAIELKHKSEIKLKNQNIQQLRNEIDQKAGTIADLMTKLRSRQKEQVVLSGELMIPVKNTKSGDVDTSRSDFSPREHAMPKEQTPKYKRRISAGKRVEVANAVIPRPPSSRRIKQETYPTANHSSSASDEQVPDPTPFLQNPNKSESQDVSKAVRAPLPPISQRDEHFAQTGLLQSGNQGLAFIKRRLRRAKGDASKSSEVQTLALDQTKDTVQRRPQPSDIP